MKTSLLILPIFLFLFGTEAWSFSNMDLIQGQPNNQCGSAHRICRNVQQEFNFNVTENGQTSCRITPLYFDVFVSSYSELTLHSLSGAKYEVYGPFEQVDIKHCESVLSYKQLLSQGQWSSNPATLVIPSIGYYFIKITPSLCVGSFQIHTSSSKGLCEEELPCENCLPSFSPSAGKYVLSAWVKEKDASNTVLTYTGISIEVTYSGNATVHNFIPSGRIIDGWQRIEGIVDIPSNANTMHIQFKVNSPKEAYFDDVRFFPNDGSMMSYVYDPVTLRLRAELDERNYATLYEYDEEGKLVRVKKETEKGIMTIQENRDNIKKN